MTDDVVAAITELEARRYEAMLAGDVAALDELCSERLSYTHSRGERDSKRSYLDKVSAGIFHYHEIAHPADAVVVLDGAVLLTGRMTARVTVAGEMRHIENAYLAVWAQEDGGWRFIAYQPTPIIRS